MSLGTRDLNGDYEFATKDPGIYALRLVLPKKAEAGLESRALAVALEPAADKYSIPDMTAVQPHCAGVQLFGRSQTGDSWEEQ